MRFSGLGLGSGYALLALLTGCGAARTPAPQVASSAPAPAAAPRAEAQVAPPPDLLESSTPIMPHAVTSFGAAAQGEFVYALGGYAGVPHAYSREGQSGDLWRLSTRDGTWTQLAGVEPVQGAALVALPRGLMRVGGMRALNAQGETEQIVSLMDADLYDPEAASWTALPPLPETRSSHAVARLGQRVFVVGGWTLNGARSEGRFAEQGYVFDVDARSWSPLPQPFRLRAIAAAPLDGSLVVMGGIDGTGATSRAVHVLNPETGAWTRAADLPSDGFGMAAASSEDVLYASTRNGVVYALDAPTAAWREVEQLAFPRFFHQLVRLDDARLVALGGISGMHFGARIRPVELFPETGEGPALLTFTLENPLRGRNRQGVFVDGDSLYALGGNRSLAQHDFAPDDFVSDAGRLDLAGMFWERLPNFPVGRQTMSSLVVGERALLVGGFGHDGKEARAQADAYAFSLENERFEPAPNRLPTPRTQFGLTEYQGRLWIFGGLNFDPAQAGEAQFDHPRSVLRADLDKPFEPAGIDLPRPRRAFGGAQLDGKYYLVGGMAAGFAPVAQCDVFDFATSQWSDIPCPTPRISPQLVALDGKLYLAGGSSPNAQGQLADNPSLEVFDPKTRTWRTVLETLPIAPRNLSMSPFHGQLLLYSAHNEQGVVHVALIKR